MKNFTTLFAFIIGIFFSYSLFAQTNFEGVVHTTSTSDQVFKGTFTLKKNLAVMESNTDNGLIQILFNSETGDMTSITNKDGEKMAVKMNMNNNPYLAQMKKGDIYRMHERDEDAEVTVTNETKTIRGYECVKVIGKDNNSEGVAWVAQSLKLDMTDLIPQAKKYLGSNKTMQDFTGVEGFIMEMEMKDLKTGKVTKLENEVIEKSIPDSYFTGLTEGAEVFDMTDMRQMMIDAQNNPEKMQKMREMMIKMNKE